MFLNLQNRQIGLGIGADDAGLVLLRVTVQLHLDLVHFLDNVIVGDDVAVAVHDEARARLSALVRDHILRAWLLPKEAEELLHLVGVAATLRRILFLIILLLLLLPGLRASPSLPLLRSHRMNLCLLGRRSRLGGDVNH